MPNSDARPGRPVGVELDHRLDQAADGLRHFSVEEPGVTVLRRELEQLLAALSAVRAASGRDLP